MSDIRVGTAGWSVDRSLTGFAQEGTVLQRYASVLSMAEINSSFYRRHQSSTWQRWHDAVPADFAFTVKLSKSITHAAFLVAAEGELDVFFDDIQPLGAKLTAVLVQLPPKLTFESSIAKSFLEALRTRTALPIFIEPRHASWAATAASGLLVEYGIGRVYADPQIEPLRSAAIDSQSCYLRLHGSPKVYYSPYSDDQLADLARLLSVCGKTSWCVFDNTASGAALKDAVRLTELLKANAQFRSQQS